MGLTEIHFYFSSQSSRSLKFSVFFLLLQYDANGGDDAPNDARYTTGWVVIAFKKQVIKVNIFFRIASFPKNLYCPNTLTLMCERCLNVLVDCVLFIQQSHLTWLQGLECPTWPQPLQSLDQQYQQLSPLSPNLSSPVQRRWASCNIQWFLRYLPQRCIKKKIVSASVFSL